MVVGRGQHHRLRDAELAQPLGRGVGPLGGVGDCPGGDDRALPAEQPRHRGDSAEPTRVGQRDVGALEVVRGQLALPRLRDQLLVVAVEGGEVEPLRPLDRRHHQAVRPILALDINRDPQVDRVPLDRKRLPILALEHPSHNWMRLSRLHDRPGDQMSKGNLHPPLFKRRVKSLPLRIQRVHRNRPERSSRRHLPALVHSLSQHRRRPPKLLLLPSGSRTRTVPSRQHIVLGHLGAGTRPSYRAKIDAIGLSHSAGNGSRPDSAAPVGAPASSSIRFVRGWRCRGHRPRGRFSDRRGWWVPCSDRTRG